MISFLHLNLFLLFYYDLEYKIKNSWYFTIHIDHSNHKALEFMITGGEGKIGKTTDIRGWDSESGRSVAHVTWQSGSTNVYRVGHKGKVDLKYIQSAPGWTYYKEHLPVLGKKIQQVYRIILSEFVMCVFYITSFLFQWSGEFTDVVAQGGIPCQFKVGDKVRVDLEADILKCMQEGHGGWNPRMAEVLNMSN